jgi:hypothetical protein
MVKTTNQIGFYNSFIWFYMVAYCCI